MRWRRNLILALKLARQAGNYRAKHEIRNTKHEIRNMSMPWKRAKVTACATLILIIAVLGIYQWGWHAAPPRQVISRGPVLGPLRVFPASEAILIILPDGSLWRWGLSLPWAQPARMLEEIGAGRRWRKVSVYWGTCVGVDDNGRLWRWPSGLVGQQVQIDPGQDWLDVTPKYSHQNKQSTMYWMAFKTDGTIWAWGDGANDRPTNLFKISAASDWKAIFSQEHYTVALRGDGTLWSWDRIGTGLTFSAPAQIGSDSNWVSFTGNFGWTRDGGSFVISASPPFHIADGGSNLVDGRFAFGQTSYEVRNDGTLWGRKSILSGMQVPPYPQWERFGRRSDWTSVCGANNAFLGLTSDGTVWAWGMDLDIHRVPSFWTGLADWANARLEPFGPALPARSNERKDPWSLMRLTASNSPAGGSRPANVTAHDF
jgi:hypothetical protein